MNSATSITAVHAAVQRGDLEEAAALAAALPEGTSSSEALHMAALLDTQFGRLGDAVERLERAVQIDGKRAAWWRDLGVVRLSLERWSEAADAFQCAIELEEGDGGVELRQCEGPRPRSPAAPVRRCEAGSIPPRWGWRWRRM